MKLQISLDLVDTKKALEMTEQIKDIIDIVEVGTPMIIREGLHPVRELKSRYKDLCVLADTKIVDGGEIESADAFMAGADIVTVLAFSQDETIKGVVKTAKKFNRKTMADMICIKDITIRAKELDQMGVDYICIHTAVDVQSTGQSPYADLAAIHPLLKNAKSALAGGVNIQSVPKFYQYNPEIVVVGGALTSQENLREAVIQMQNELK